MSVIRKIDVERRRKEINLCGPVGQPAETSFSVAVPVSPDTNVSAFFEDYSGEHSIPGKSAMPTKLMGIRAPGLSKRTVV